MTSLLEKGREFKWDEKCQESFDQLKERCMWPRIGMCAHARRTCDRLRVSSVAEA
jgi:hypothetical protein